MKVEAVDLFCGIGGLTKGLSDAGMKVVGGVDIDETCKYPYEYNNKTQFIQADIRKIESEILNSLFTENKYKVLVGCAPCQPFSKYTHRYRKDGQKDQKWNLLNSFLRHIKNLNPHVISMENVPQLCKEKIFMKFVKTLKSLKYSVSWEIINCANYGVPQNRKRLVLLASRLGEISLIKPSHPTGKEVSVRKAIGKLPSLLDGQINEKDKFHRSCKLSPKNLMRIAQSVPGGTWRDWDESLQADCHKKKSGTTFPSVYGRMCWDSPSPTITTQFYGYGNGRFGHPEQNRAISLREGALLQSFPKSYKLYDNKKPIKISQVGMHIGNAVPVKLALAIGKSIIRHIEEVESFGERNFI